MSNGRLNLATLTDVGGQKYLRPDAAKQWLLMRADCRAQTGVYLGLTEGYRDYNRQVYLRALWKAGLGNLAAVPGTSNHGLAIALDINNYEPAWGWLQANAARYGFSWAQGKASGERWHWVFVGGATITTPAGLGKPIEAEQEETLRIQIIETAPTPNAPVQQWCATATGGLVYIANAVDSVLLQRLDQILDRDLKGLPANDALNPDQMAYLDRAYLTPAR